MKTFKHVKTGDKIYLLFPETNTVEDEIVISVINSDTGMTIYLGNQEEIFIDSDELDTWQVRNIFSDPTALFLDLKYKTPNEIVHKT